MRRREGEARAAPVASRSARVAPPPREVERPRAAQAPRRGPARAQSEYSSESDEGDSYSSGSEEEQRRAPPPPRGAPPPRGDARRAPPQRAAAPPPAAPATNSAACSSLFPASRPARCAPPLGEIIDRALVPDANSHAARVAAELARRYPQSFQRLTSQLQPRTRVRLISALNLQGDGGDEARERHGLSSDAIAAWRDQAAAAGRGRGAPAPRRPARSEAGSEASDSRYESGSGSDYSDGSEEEEEEEEDAEAEYQALARIARDWERAEAERAAREEDAKDLATMMRLCCIAMKPTAAPADKGEQGVRNRPPLRQRKDSRGGSAPRAQPPPTAYREAPAVEARRAREEIQRDTSQNRHRQRGGTAGPRQY